MLQKEGTGTDGVNVAWQWTAHGTTYPLEGPIPSMRLSPWTDASYDLSGQTAPSSLTATPLSSTQIRLNWLAAGDPQSGVSQYNIYRGGQYVGTTTGLTYTDGGLSQTTTYSYTVTASNGSKFEGPASNFASAQPGPSLLSASPMDDQHIQLTFGKAVSEIPAGTLANYTLTDSVGRVIAIDSAVWDDVSQKIVTLSLGERPEEDLIALREAGADRYLLRFETSDRELYDRIHPPRPGQERSDRFALLRQLRELGYEVGSGVMIGIPGQTYGSLARDVEAFAELDLDMIGVGPWLPHPETPLGESRVASRESRAEIAPP